MFSNSKQFFRLFGLSVASATLALAVPSARAEIPSPAGAAAMPPPSAAAAMGPGAPGAPSAPSPAGAAAPPPTGAPDAAFGANPQAAVQAVAAPTQAETEKQNVAGLDNSKIDRQGTIADTTADRIAAKQVTLKPEFGFEDIFLVPKGDSVIDTDKVGIEDQNQICFRTTSNDIVVKSDPNPTGGRRIYVGDKVGSTQVLIYDGKGPECKTLGNLLKVYRVTVSQQDLVQLLQQLKVLLGDIEGLEIRIVGNQVVLDGKVLVPADIRRIRAVLAKQTNKPILSLFEVSPITLKLIAEKMQEEINGGKDRAPEVKVKVVNGRFFLDGIVDKEYDRQLDMKICQSYIPPKYTLEPDGAVAGRLEAPTFGDLADCVVQIRIRGGQAKDPDPIISVRVDFVTLNRDYAKYFDFRWGPGISSDNGNVTYSSDTGNFLTTFTGTLKNLFPKLNSARTHGYARVLKTATVLVRDGDKPDGTPDDANINETLSIPYILPPTQPGAASTPGSTNVVTEVNVSARSIPGSDKINMKISATQAEQVGVPNSAGQPSILQTKVNTALVVPNNDSAALGGMITERRNVAQGRDPAESNTSDFRIFDLDRKSQFTDTKGQFIIFVTPTKLRSTTEGTDALKRKFRLRK